MLSFLKTITWKVETVKKGKQVEIIEWDEKDWSDQFYALNSPLSNCQHDQIYLTLFGSFSIKITI